MTIEELSNDRAVIRYTVDSADRIRVWGCWSGYKDGVPGIYYTDGIEGGKIKDPIFKAAKEKNIGKANYISAEDQADIMVMQEVGKKERSNYFSTTKEARENKLWLPMLCPSGMKWKDYAGNPKKVTYPAYASNKFDGARCNVFLKDDEVYSQTRTGKQWMNNLHIETALEDVLGKYPNLIFDGELYNHDYRNNFEDLMSIIKKAKPTKEQREFSENNVQYHIYDIYDLDNPDLLFEQRQALLENIFEEFGFSQHKGPLVHAESVVVRSDEDFDHFHSTALKIGYEGSILRLDAPYEVDKRSKFLLKRKELFDCEFKILDVIEGEGTNAGIAAKVVISLLDPNGMNAEHQEALTGLDFQDAGMAAGWNHDRCRDLLVNKHHVIGKMATIEYFEITGHGLLRFPKLKAIRDYE